MAYIAKKQIIKGGSTYQAGQPLPDSLVDAKIWAAWESAGFVAKAAAEPKPEAPAPKEGK